MTDPFVAYMREWIARYGTADRLASAIGMTLSAFSRGVRNQHTLGIESLLRFAKETSEPPGKVLRLAGKAHVAELLEDLYGTPDPSNRLDGQQRELLQLWATISETDRASVKSILKGLARRPTPPRRRHA